MARLEALILLANTPRVARFFLHHKPSVRVTGLQPKAEASSGSLNTQCDPQDGSPGSPTKEGTKVSRQGTQNDDRLVCGPSSDRMSQDSRGQALASSRGQSKQTPLQSSTFTATLTKWKSDLSKETQEVRRTSAGVWTLFCLQQELSLCGQTC